MMTTEANGDGNTATAAATNKAESPPRPLLVDTSTHGANESQESESHPIETVPVNTDTNNVVAATSSSASSQPQSSNAASASTSNINPTSSATATPGFPFLSPAMTPTSSAFFMTPTASSSATNSAFYFSQISPNHNDLHFFPTPLGSPNSSPRNAAMMAGLNGMHAQSGSDPHHHAGTNTNQQQINTSSFFTTPIASPSGSGHLHSDLANVSSSSSSDPSAASSPLMSRASFLGQYQNKIVPLHHGGLPLVPRSTIVQPGGSPLSNAALPHRPIPRPRVASPTSTPNVNTATTNNAAGTTNPNALTQFNLPPRNGNVVGGVASGSTSMSGLTSNVPTNGGISGQMPILSSINASNQPMPFPNLAGSPQSGPFMGSMHNPMSLLQMQLNNNNNHNSMNNNFPYQQQQPNHFTQPQNFMPSPQQIPFPIQNLSGMNVLAQMNSNNNASNMNGPMQLPTMIQQNMNTNASSTSIPSPPTANSSSAANPAAATAAVQPKPESDSNVAPSGTGVDSTSASSTANPTSTTAAPTTSSDSNAAAPVGGSSTNPLNSPSLTDYHTQPATSPLLSSNLHLHHPHSSSLQFGVNSLLALSPHGSPQGSPHQSPQPHMHQPMPIGSPLQGPMYQNPFSVYPGSSYPSSPAHAHTTAPNNVNGMYANDSSHNNGMPYYMQQPQQQHQPQQQLMSVPPLLHPTNANGISSSISSSVAGSPIPQQSNANYHDPHWSASQMQNISSLQTQLNHIVQSNESLAKQFPPTQQPNPIRQPSPIMMQHQSSNGASNEFPPSNAPFHPSTSPRNVFNQNQGQPPPLMPSLASTPASSLNTTSSNTTAMIPGQSTSTSPTKGNGADEFVQLQNLQQQLTMQLKQQQEQLQQQAVQIQWQQQQHSLYMSNFARQQQQQQQSLNQTLNQHQQQLQQQIFPPPMVPPQFNQQMPIGGPNNFIPQQQQQQLQQQQQQQPHYSPTFFNPAASLAQRQQMSQFSLNMQHTDPRLRMMQNGVNDSFKLNPSHEMSPSSGVPRLPMVSAPASPHDPYTNIDLTLTSRGGSLSGSPAAQSPYGMTRTIVGNHASSSQHASPEAQHRSIRPQVINSQASLVAAATNRTHTSNAEAQKQQAPIPIARLHQPATVKKENESVPKVNIPIGKPIKLEPRRNASTTAAAASYSPPNPSAALPDPIVISTGAKKTSKFYPCSYEGCSELLKTRFSLKRHMKKHTGEKPHVCPYGSCGKSFPEASTLKRHLRIHTGEKPFKCSFQGCNKAFADATNVKRHEMTHTGEKPYKCLVTGCPRSFSRGSSLRQHMVTMHHLDVNDSILLASVKRGRLLKMKKKRLKATEVLEEEAFKNNGVADIIAQHGISFPSSSPATIASAAANRKKNAAAAAASSSAPPKSAPARRASAKSASAPSKASAKRKRQSTEDDDADEEEAEEEDDGEEIDEDEVSGGGESEEDEEEPEDEDD